jgi:large subunit ribosomal protein L27
MAHTKAKGTTKLGRDSESKRLGVKIYGGSPIKCGQIIIRQRGTSYLNGEGVGRGGDDTLYAVHDGVVVFKKVRYTNFTGNAKTKQIVSVESIKPKEKPAQKEKVAKIKSKSTPKPVAKTSKPAKTVDKKNK